MACDRGRPDDPAERRAGARESVLGFPMRKFLVVLLIFLAVVVVVADIAARSFAQNTIADQSAQHLGMSEKPEVSIEGWAFLPQALAGTYSEININSDSATVNGHTFEQIDASAR